MSKCDKEAFELPDQPSVISLTVSHPWVPPIRATSSKHLGRLSWAEKLEHFLHSHLVHRIVIGLLGLDMLLVLTGGVLESQYLASEISDYEAFVDACTSAASGSSGSRLLLDASGQEAWWRSTWRTARRLGGGSVDCSHPHFGNHTLHDIERVAILFIFLIENLLLILCMGRGFFVNPFFVLDFVVVALSIALELLAITGRFEYTSFVGLLVLARVWRFARVGHGVYAAGERQRHVNGTNQTNNHCNHTCEPAAAQKASQVAPE